MLLLRWSELGFCLNTRVLWPMGAFSYGLDEFMEAIFLLHPFENIDSRIQHTALFGGHQPQRVFKAVMKPSVMQGFDIHAG